MDAPVAESPPQTDPSPGDSRGSAGLREGFRPAGFGGDDALVGWFGADGSGPYPTANACHDDGKSRCNFFDSGWHFGVSYRAPIANSSGDALVRASTAPDASHGDGDPHPDPEGGGAADKDSAGCGADVWDGIDRRSALQMVAATCPDANPVPDVRDTHSWRHLYREWNEAWHVWNANGGGNADLGRKG